MLMSCKDFTKNVGIIALTRMLTRLGGLLLLPIITKTLGPNDYGVWAQINITVSLLSPVALMGLSVGLIRFLSSERDIEKIREEFFSVLFLVVFTGLGTSLMLFFSSNFLATNLFNDVSKSYLIKAASFLILLGTVDEISLFYFRIFQQIKMFSMLNLFQTFGQLIFIYIFLSIGYGLLGVICALLIVQGLIFLISIHKIISQIGFSIPKFSRIRDYLKYSLPLTPNSLIRWITDSSDRYMISYFLGLSSVGIYSASYAIGNIIQLLIFPIQFVLFPEISKIYDEENIDKVKVYLSYSLKYFLLLAIPTVFGLSALSKPILEIFTTNEFISGSNAVPFIALSGLLAGVFQIVVNIINLVNKTRLNIYIQIFSAILNVILNICLIPSIGIVGAAIATLVSYTLMVMMCIHVSFKHFVFDLNLNFILKSILASSIMYESIFYISPSNIIGLVESVITGAIVYFVIMILIKGISENEINKIKNLLPL